MRPAPLDRTGTLYANAPTVGPSGAVKPLLTRFCDLPCRIATPQTRTILAGERDASQTEAVFETRYFQGLKTGMVFVVEGISYRVVRFDPVGRYDRWMIYGRNLS